MKKKLTQNAKPFFLGIFTTVVIFLSLLFTLNQYKVIYITLNFKGTYEYITKYDYIGKFKTQYKIGWKRYDDQYLSFDYPGTWEVRSDNNRLVIQDPKSCYHTSSRPPVICERSMGLTAKDEHISAKDYVNAEFAQMEKEQDEYFDKHLGQGYPKDRRYDLLYKNPTAFYGAPRLLIARESVGNGNTQIELYSVNVESAWRGYGVKQIIISNGQRLYIGSGSLKSIYELTNESQIIKSIKLK